MNEKPVRVGTPPYSSYDPQTDSNKMIPIGDLHENDPEAQKQARTIKVVEGDDGAVSVENDSVKSYDELTVDELAEIAADRGVEVEGNGKDGNKLKADYVKALEDADANGESDEG